MSIAECTPTTNMTATRSNVSGIGAQTFLEVKSYAACSVTLQQAYEDIKDTRAAELKKKINALIIECNDLAIAAGEAIKDNA